MALTEINAGEMLRSTPVKSPERSRSKNGEKGNAIVNRNPNFSSDASIPLVSYKPVIYTGEMLRSTPVKSPERFRLKNGEKGVHFENRNPNISSAASSPVASGNKSVKKSCLRSPNLIVPGKKKKKMAERRFMVAMKRSNKVDNSSSDDVSCKCIEKSGLDVNKKCLCTAYERLRASQKEFFKNRDDDEDEINGDDDEHDSAKTEILEVEEVAKNDKDSSLIVFESENASKEANERLAVGNSVIKRRREMVMEEARKSVPELGAGKVKHLVNAFEKLRLIHAIMVDEKEKKISQWALPGMQVKVSESEPNESFSIISASDMFLTSENLGLDLHNASLWISGQGSLSSRISGGGERKSRRTSMESTCTVGGRKWKKKQPRVTSLKPFKLRTEERGRLKEEELMKKIEKMTEEQEKLWIPVAQSLPWTTDEPECLVKPPVKEITKPIDVTLHTDLRAVERAEFDQQVAEKLSLIEQYKAEKDKLQKLSEEEETRRLRRELVPKAQPMPYFDRPFIPKRSMKHPTIPREPKFHVPQNKKIKGGLSWNDIVPYTYNAGL